MLRRYSDLFVDQSVFLARQVAAAMASRPRLQARYDRVVARQAGAQERIEAAQAKRDRRNEHRAYCAAQMAEGQARSRGRLERAPC